MSKRGISLCLIFATLVLNMFLPQENARAEVCPTYNFQSLFSSLCNSCATQTRATQLSSHTQTNDLHLCNHHFQRRPPL